MDGEGEGGADRSRVSVGVIGLRKGLGEAEEEEEKRDEEGGVERVCDLEGCGRSKRTCKWGERARSRIL